MPRAGPSSWPRLRRSATLGVSILSDSHDEACRQLASRAGDRFAGLRTTRTESGAILLDGAAALYECSVHDEFSAGDHDIILFRILALSAQPAALPLVFHGSQFHRLAAAS